eukprot:27273-Pleurochrysis_carterae.AAC.3
MRLGMRWRWMLGLGSVYARTGFEQDWIKPGATSNQTIYRKENNISHKDANQICDKNANQICHKNAEQNGARDRSDAGARSNRRGREIDTRPL